MKKPTENRLIRLAQTIESWIWKNVAFVIIILLCIWMLIGWYKLNK